MSVWCAGARKKQGTALSTRRAIRIKWKWKPAQRKSLQTERPHAEHKARTKKTNIASKMVVIRNGNEEVI